MAAVTMPPTSESVGSSEIKKKPSNGNGKRKKDTVSSNATFGVNLMPAELKAAISATGEKSFTHRFAMSVVWALFLSGLLYGGMWGYGYYLRITSLQQTITDIATADQRMADLEKKRVELTAFKSRLESVQKLLDQHQYWSHFFDVLEKNTITDVSYINVISAKGGTVTLSGFAKDYDAVARQLLVLQNAKDTIASASINSASAVLNSSGDVMGVNFSVLINLKGDVLKRTVSTTPTAPSAQPGSNPSSLVPASSTPPLPLSLPNQ